MSLLAALLPPSKAPSTALPLPIARQPANQRHLYAQAMKQRAAAEDAKKPARTSKGLATRTRSTNSLSIGCAGFHSCFEKPSSASAHLACRLLAAVSACSEQEPLFPPFLPPSRLCALEECEQSQQQSIMLTPPRLSKCRGTLSRAPYGMPKTASSQNAIADCLPHAPAGALRGQSQ